ncbi:MAG: gamma carbonic anhydrase family protein, partial [Rikenellaceae bacterium]|nr:gamma carbonic anhydrase family protein [Rikenellaceae bacterium]
MAIIKKVRGYEPEIGENTFLAESATIIGNCKIGKDCSIWYGAVLRG